jgi:hypothetical protein
MADRYRSSRAAKAERDGGDDQRRGNQRGGRPRPLILNLLGQRMGQDHDMPAMVHGGFDAPPL